MSVLIKGFTIFCWELWAKLATSTQMQIGNLPTRTIHEYVGSAKNLALTVFQCISTYDMFLFSKTNFKFTQKSPHAFNILYTLLYALPHRANVASELLNVAPKRATALEHKLAAASSADSRPGESSRCAGDYTVLAFASTWFYCVCVCVCEKQ